MDQFSLVEAMDRFKDRDLVGSPGKVYQYTTYGYVVLGVIIQKLSGMPYEGYMKKHIWEPAGMNTTSVENKSTTYPNKSALYKVTDKGELKKDYDTNLSIKVPGGGIQSTAGDLLRFGQALIDNTLLKKETLEQMMEDPQIRKGGNPYGMGWFLYGKSDSENGRVIGHSGSQAGTSTQLLILLDKGIVVSCMSNTRGQWGKIFNMCKQLVNLTVFPEERAKPLNKIIAMSTTDLDRFLGKYRFENGEILSIKRKGNQLYSDLNQFKGVKLYPESETRIFYRDVDAYFEFERDTIGEIVKTTYSQGERQFSLEKIE
jgi:CubicO group peptidase (beta-lactamase class C family)